MDIGREALSEPRLRSICADRRHIGTSVRVLESTASTNDACHEAAGNKAALGLAIFAESQTAGRGQHGRSWRVPARSSLLFSILLEGQGRNIEPFVLVGWSALSVCETLTEAFDLPARIRWPNDVVIRGKKIAGILVERRSETVVGIGLNVNLSREDLPTECRIPPTSVQVEAGRIVDRTALAGALLERLDENFLGFAVHGNIDGMLTRWRAFADVPADAYVTAVTRRTQVLGRLRSLDPREGARILDERGIIAHIPAAELVSIEQLA